MKNKKLVLLRAFIQSTSLFNLLKYSRDKKKKSNATGSLAGMAVLYIFLIGYCVLNSIGYGMYGMADSIPVLCALVISAMSFLFTLLKANAYIFGFKEYDMIVSLPFEIKTIVADKFLYMYLKSFPWIISISASMLVGYAIYEKPAFAVYPLWILLTLFVPLIPMVLATFIGFLIAKIGTGFKHKKAVQMILTLVFVLLSFSLRFIIEGIMRDNKIEEVLGNISNATMGIASYYLPAGWFSGSVVSLKLSDMLLLVGVSILLFEVCFSIISKSYRKINSALKSHAANKKFKMAESKKSSVVKAVAFKEFKRLTGSTVYLTNAGLGYILAIIVGIVALVVGADKLIAIITQNAPVSKEMLMPSIPLLVYFMVGMVSTTTCSPSLEGKNFWIVKSLPIKVKDWCLGKMLLNMYVAVPSMAVSTICISISAKAGFWNTIMYLICGFTLCAFSTTFGLVCGLKHIKLEFENDVEVVKQGAAVVLYLFPNMFITMILVVLAVIFGMRVNGNILIGGFSVIMILLSIVCYKRSLSLALKKI